MPYTRVALVAVTTIVLAGCGVQNSPVASDEPMVLEEDTALFSTTQQGDVLVEPPTSLSWEVERRSLEDIRIARSPDRVLVLVYDDVDQAGIPIEPVKQEVLCTPDGSSPDCVLDVVDEGHASLEIRPALPRSAYAVLQAEWDPTWVDDNSVSLMSWGIALSY